jgi:hypothetical protein
MDRIRPGNVQEAGPNVSIFGKNDRICNSAESPRQKRKKRLQFVFIVFAPSKNVKQQKLNMLYFMICSQFHDVFFQWPQKCPVGNRNWKISLQIHNTNPCTNKGNRDPKLELGSGSGGKSVLSFSHPIHRINKGLIT